MPFSLGISLSLYVVRCYGQHRWSYLLSHVRFSHTNPLHQDVFQSVARYEAEVVAMTAALLGSREPASGGQICGNMTSGGTESILLAVKTSRDYMRTKKGITKPEMWVKVSLVQWHFRKLRYLINICISLIDFTFPCIYRIIPGSAHSAYDKAAQYFNIKLWRVPVNKDYVADVKRIRRCINGNTILVFIVIHWLLLPHYILSFTSFHDYPGS